MACAIECRHLDAHSDRRRSANRMMHPKADQVFRPTSARVMSPRFNGAPSGSKDRQRPAPLGGMESIKSTKPRDQIRPDCRPAEVTVDRRGPVEPDGSTPWSFTESPPRANEDADHKGPG